MFDLDSPINKGKIAQIIVDLDPLKSTINYYIGIPNGGDLVPTGSDKIHLEQDGTIELLQVIQQTANMQEIKQALENFLKSKGA